MKRVLLVTGASRGIGAATARLAAARGYAVAVNYRRDRAGAEDVATSIVRAGGRAVALAADVGIEAEVVRLFEECDAALGPMTGFVNNAGVLDTQSRAEHIDAARLAYIYTDMHASGGSRDVWIA